MEESEENLYELLGLSTGLESSVAEIRKAYRKRALESHPDKRPGDKNAAAEFDRIQKAYEVLSDEAARHAYDGVLRVRKERELRTSQQSSKRQKMVADLLARERASESQRNEEESARSRLKGELDRLRRQTAERRRGVSSAQGSESSRSQIFESEGVNLSKERKEELERTLKVTWSKLGGDAYPAQRITELFQDFGTVEDLVVRSGKKNKGSALIVMSTKEAAIAATRAVCGDVSNPLLVVPAAPEGESGFPEAGFTGTTNFMADSEKGNGFYSGPVGNSVPTVGRGFKDFESLTLMRMRQAAERAKIIREMEDKDKEENKK